MRDPLTDVLSTLRMRSTLYFRTDFRAPWGVEVSANPGVIRFHVVVEGDAWIRVGGSWSRMRRGDLVLVPSGAAHALTDHPERRTARLDAVLRETAFNGQDALAYGGGGESTVLVCGHFAFDDDILHPVLDALPPLVHLSAARGHDFTWLDAATRAVARETNQRAPGWEVVINRVSDILFIQALRAASDIPGVSSRVAAFGDQHLSKSLSAMHFDPAHPWTLDALARVAGMSRTVFAEAFRERLGMTPMAYLSRWRLQRARRDLLDSDDNVLSVAMRAGYASEAAFCRAFQRLYDAPPGRYRRAHRASRESHAA